MIFGQCIYRQRPTKKRSHAQKDTRSLPYWFEVAILTISSGLSQVLGSLDFVLNLVPQGNFRLQFQICEAFFSATKFEPQIVGVRQNPWTSNYHQSSG